MKWVFWLLGLFAAAVGVASVANNPGYVQFVYPPYRVEMSLTLFVLICVGGFILIYLTTRLVFMAIDLPQQVRRFRAERAVRKGRAAMREALRAYFEGRYTVAERLALRAVELNEEPGLSALLAAHAAHELRKFDRRDAYLERLAGGAEDTMRLLAKAAFLLDQKQPRSALQSLRALNAVTRRKHAGILNLELKVQLQLRDWAAVQQVAAQLEQRRAIDLAKADQIHQQAWIGKLAAASDLSALRALWKSVPAEFKRRSRVAAVAAGAFARLGDCLRARQVLAESLNREWDSELVALLGECPADNNIAEIEQAERWLQQHPNDAGLLLALGRLCMHQGLWGKAQSYLEASLGLEKTRAAYLALGQLAEKTGKQQQALVYFQQALLAEPHLVASAHSEAQA